MRHVVEIWLRKNINPCAYDLKCRVPKAGAIKNVIVCYSKIFPFLPQESPPRDGFVYGSVDRTLIHDSHNYGHNPLAWREGSKGRKSVWLFETLKYISSISGVCRQGEREKEGIRRPILCRQASKRMECVVVVVSGLVVVVRRAT